MSTYRSPHRGRWGPVTAGLGPPCWLPSLPDSRVPPDCHWLHKTCDWGQPHNGPHLMPLQCRAPTNRTHLFPRSSSIINIRSRKFMYLVRRKAVERSNWSQVCRLELTQVGQQRQLSVLITALVFPVTTRSNVQAFADQIRTPSHRLQHSRCSLPCDTLEVWLDGQMGVAPGGGVALCKLIQGRLGWWVSLVTLCRPQKLWCEGSRLGKLTLVQLHHMWNREKADHVHQQLKSKPCGWPKKGFGLCLN